MDTFIDFLAKLVSYIPDETRDFVLLVFILLFVAYLLWHLYLQHREKKAESSLASSTELSQIMEQYSAATTHLNMQSLGSIYSLEWIARYSKLNREPVIANLVAYIRENAPRCSETANHRSLEAVSMQGDEALELCLKVSAMLLVLGRLRRTDSNEKNQMFSNERISLSEIELPGAKLANAMFSGDCFVRSNLSNACLENATLERTDFGETNLENADLKGANLSGADLVKASLKRANLTQANLTGANLSHADLEGAVLWGANLEGANLWGANLKGADLAGCNLKRARFFGANLTRTILDNPRHHDAEVFEGAVVIEGHEQPIWIP